MEWEVPGRVPFGRRSAPQPGSFSMPILTTVTVTESTLQWLRYAETNLRDIAAKMAEEPDPTVRVLAAYARIASLNLLPDAEPLPQRICYPPAGTAGRGRRWGDGSAWR